MCWVTLLRTPSVCYKILFFEVFDEKFIRKMLWYIINTQHNYKTGFDVCGIVEFISSHRRVIFMKNQYIVKFSHNWFWVTFYLKFIRKMPVYTSIITLPNIGNYLTDFNIITIKNSTMASVVRHKDMVSKIFRFHRWVLKYLFKYTLHTK